MGLKPLQQGDREADRSRGFHENRIELVMSEQAARSEKAPDRDRFEAAHEQIVKSTP